LAYIEVDIIIPDNRGDGCDITVAELGSYGFESFMDSEVGVKAYINEKDFDRSVLDDLSILKSQDFGFVSITSRLIEDINWNKVWESEYEAVSIPGFCYVRSHFHPESTDHKHEILIDPKMSFGTGHHETTWLMIKMMDRINFDKKEVLDVGCGTGVLSILASKLNARYVTGLDIDSWAYKNTLENFEINQVENCEVILGEIDLIEKNTFDVVLANITRNVLLKDMRKYGALSNNNSTLLLSGFYLEDLEMITDEASKRGFSYIEHIIKNNWVSALFTRQVL
jgi:ribosomal protein L11 methyltransferase